MSGDKGARYLTEIEGSLVSIADIWSGITSVMIDDVTGSESCGSRKILLARY